MKTSRKSKPRRDQGEISPIIAEAIESVDRFCDAIEAGVPLDQVARVHTIVTRVDIPTKTYGPDEVRAVREKLQATQNLLADFLGVSVKTVRSWEQGSRAVPGIACRYLDDLQEFPELWARRLRVNKAT